ncbi:MAG: DUF5615 family PIN-like protein [Pseudonocardiaceae bacterium]
MRFLVDANLSPRIAARLCAGGYEAAHVQDHGLHLLLANLPMSRSSSVPRPRSGCHRGEHQERTVTTCRRATSGNFPPKLPSPAHQQ